MSKEFQNNVLDIVKEKWFYPYEYMSNFKKFKEGLSSTEKLCSLLTAKKLGTKDMNMFLRFGTNLKWK